MYGLHRKSEWREKRIRPRTLTAEQRRANLKYEITAKRLATMERNKPIREENRQTVKLLRWYYGWLREQVVQ